jgi:ATP-dependent Clp protease adapter protein ClpS
MLEAQAWIAYFPSNSIAADFGKETFLTTCSLSQIAPLSDPYNPSEFVKTILLHL